MQNIVIIDDEPAVCSSLRFALCSDYEVHTFTDPDQALFYIFHNDVAVVLLDIKLGKADGLDYLKKIKSRNIDTTVIIMTAYGSIESSVEAMKEGAFYYITKPIDLTNLQALLKRGVEVFELRNKVHMLDEELNQRYQINGIIGKSKAIQKVLNIVEKVKDISSNVLITGESGTGKEVIARAIHFSGKRRNANFEVVNCAAIPYNLLESELFGYEKGAFTGAFKARRGVFERAKGGTIFLDEIGEMDMALQAKLLRVIQEKVVTPLGSEISKKIDVRIIAATNCDLEEAVKKNQFREDLFYRLNVINIKMPPLRERKEDIPLLVSHFIKKHSYLQGKNINGITEEALRKLLDYNFPGNIRELENIIERGIALASGKKLSLNDISIGSLEPMRGTVEQPGNDNYISIHLGESLKTVERKIILATLDKVGGKQKEAARILGITDRTLRNKIKLYKGAKNQK